MIEKKINHGFVLHNLRWQGNSGRQLEFRKLYFTVDHMVDSSALCITYAEHTNAPTMKPYKTASLLENSCLSESQEIKQGELCNFRVWLQTEVYSRSRKLWAV